jgi:hypothetical protein
MLKRAVSQSKAAQLVEITKNLVIVGHNQLFPESKNSQ